jgi:mRNA interferase MazF
MALRRGEVVLVHYPYSSGTGSKLRPALVVQPDHNNQRLSNVILAPITTTTHRHGEPTQFLIDKSSAEGRAAGLRHTSVVTCENLSTVTQSLVKRRLGRMPDAAMRVINDCLKAALGLA